MGEAKRKRDGMSWEFRVDTRDLTNAILSRWERQRGPMPDFHREFIVDLAYTASLALTECLEKAARDQGMPVTNEEVLPQ